MGARVSERAQLRPAAHADEAGERAGPSGGSHPLAHSRRGLIRCRVQLRAQSSERVAALVHSFAAFSSMAMQLQPKLFIASETRIYFKQQHFKLVPSYFTRFGITHVALPLLTPGPLTEQSQDS